MWSEVPIRTIDLAYVLDVERLAILPRTSLVARFVEILIGCVTEEQLMGGAVITPPATRYSDRSPSL